LGDLRSSDATTGRPTASVESQQTTAQVVTDQVLAPATPSGMTLWGVTWAELTVNEVIAGREQLFSGPGGGF
jgi:hypothetical protein